MRSTRLGAIVSHPLGHRTLLRITGSAALVDNQLNDLEDGKSFSGQLSAEHALSATTGIAATFGMDHASLRDPGYSTTGWRAGLTGWRDVGRVTLSAGAELGRLHADERLLLFPDKREDRSFRLSLGATFRQLQFRRDSRRSRASPSSATGAASPFTITAAPAPSWVSFERSDAVQRVPCGSDCLIHPG